MAVQHPEPTDAPGLADRLRAAGMYALPHHLLSALMHRATRVRAAAWKDWQIQWFVRRYGVDMALAAQQDAGAYPDFNAFFTRALKSGARPISGHDTICPADGTLSRCGSIRDGLLIQAKGRTFSLTRLLGGDAGRAGAFEGGHFATVYLSPRDYHRVHMPLGGTLREMVHVPGRLFSVNPSSARAVPNLFARNERVVCIFDSEYGPLAVVLVGAVFVGSIDVVWAGQVAPAPTRGVTTWRYPRGGAGTVVLGKGQEMGRFNMGSTVVVILPPGPVRWCDGVEAGRPVTMGQGLADLE